MTVDSIDLEQFRNFKNASCSFDPGINVIAGENAQGKTNLLEAVSLLTGGKSFRTRFDAEMIAHDMPQSMIRAEIHAAGRIQHLELRLSRGQRKEIKQNGVRRKASELSDTLKAVLFCPDDLSLVKEGAAVRRKLLDTAISQLRPGYAALISEYTRLYGHKLRILRDYRDKPSLLDILDGFSENMAKASASIIRYRAAFIARLNDAAFPIHSEFSGKREELHITYKTVSTISNPLAPTSELYRQIVEHQSSHYSAELDSGQCLTGAHKDDLIITINGSHTRTYASQGQARTAALSIKLAEREIFLTETGEYPVLLLDDVLSELDRTRQEFVLNRIGGGQTLITCCEDEIAKRTGGRVIQVTGGQLSS